VEISLKIGCFSFKLLLYAAIVFFGFVLFVGFYQIVEFLIKKQLYCPVPYISFWPFET